MRELFNFLYSFFYKNIFISSIDIVNGFFGFVFILITVGGSGQPLVLSVPSSPVFSLQTFELDVPIVL